MKIAVTTTYTISTDTVLDLPEGKTWDDVARAYVKWGTLFLWFKDDTELEIDTEHSTLDNVDFKHPDSTTFRTVDADGYPEWDGELESVA